MNTNINKRLSSFIGLVLVVAMAGSFLYFQSVRAETQDQVDSDRDGLTDMLEREYGSDPLNIDTDGDGYTDYQEVRTGYDPTKPAPGDELEGASNDLEEKIREEVADPLEEESAEDETSASEEESTVEPAETDVYYDETITDETNLTDVFSGAVSYIEGQTETSSQDVTLEDVEKIIGTVIPEEQKILKIPSIEEEKIKVEEVSNKENLQSYFLAMNSTFVNNFLGSQEEKQEIFVNKNYEPFQKYAKDIFGEEGNGAVDMQLMFQRIYEDGLEFTVPREALEAHKIYLSSMKAYDLIFEDVALMEDDPIRALVAYNKFDQANIYMQGYYKEYERLRVEYDLVLE